MSPVKPKKKKKSSSSPIWLKKLISFLRGPGRPVVLVALLAAGLVGVWCALWYGAGVGKYVRSWYAVDQNQVEITPLPDWIHTDVRAEVFRDGSLDGQLSYLDDDLTERIYNAFSLHPWIAKVVRVRKHWARVKVDLAYRRPVCMVELRGQLLLLPVDARGVLLPHGDDEFSSVEKSRYPRLVGVDTAPVGTVGECWGDARVVGGAEIAASLGEAWDELKLSQIVPSSPLTTGYAEEYTYTLLTRGGTRIFWGRAPGSDAPGELPAAEKLARLREYIAEQGTLEGRNAPQKLDVYRLQPPRLSSRPKR